MLKTLNVPCKTMVSSDYIEKIASNKRSRYMENFEQNSTDGSAGKDESSEKVTFRLPPATVQRIKDQAIAWGVSQSAAAHRLLSEETVSPYARPLIQGASATGAEDDDNDDVPNFENEDEEKAFLERDIGKTWDRVNELHNTTNAIEHRMEEINRLQSAMINTLKSETDAALKAIKNFSGLAKNSEVALRHFGELEKKFLGSFDVQKSTVKEYLEQTHQAIVSGAFKGYDLFEERAEKKLRAAERLIERADHLDSSFANYFTNGVQHFLPEVERLKGTIENDLKKIKIFNGISYAVGGLVFLLGIAAVTYYRPALELWDKSQVATAATKSVTEAYSKELTAAQNQVNELESKFAKLKQDEERRIEEIRIDEKLKAREAIENYRIKSFEKQAQRYQKEIEESSFVIGHLQKKLAANCRFFCFGDYDD
jgi:hypothetical protein